MCLSVLCVSVCVCVCCCFKTNARCILKNSHVFLLENPEDGYLPEVQDIPGDPKKLKVFLGPQVLEIRKTMFFQQFVSELKFREMTERKKNNFYHN